jgi:hypothetical protein
VSGVVTGQYFVTGVVMGQCFVTGEMCCSSALKERMLISRNKRKKRAEQAD